MASAAAQMIINELVGCVLLCVLLCQLSVTDRFGCQSLIGMLLLAPCAQRFSVVWCCLAECMPLFGALYTKRSHDN